MNNVLRTFEELFRLVFFTGTNELARKEKKMGMEIFNFHWISNICEIRLIPDRKFGLDWLGENFVFNLLRIIYGESMAIGSSLITADRRYSHKAVSRRWHNASPSIIADSVSGCYFIGWTALRPFTSLQKLPY